MKFAPCVLVAVLAATAVAGCADPYYRGTRYGYTPQYAYAYPSESFLSSALRGECPCCDGLPHRGSGELKAAGCSV